MLAYETRQDITALQEEDLAMFGRLVFSLCCNNLAAINNVPKALETLSRQYSGDMKNVALFLISKPGPHKVRYLRIRVCERHSHLILILGKEHRTIVRYDR